MKNLHKISFVALFGLAFAGCADLDTAPLGSTVTADQKADVVEADPSKVKASVTAIASNFTQYGKIYGNDQHNDFGYPSIMMFTDTKGTDMVSDDIGYNWFSEPLTYSDVLNTASTTHMIWGTLYNQIYSANSVTGTIDSATEDPILQFYLAQAYAIRAFDYFTLVQLYQFNYKGHESELGVPIITEENAEKVAAEGCVRSTVQETYDFILKDISAAIELLEKTSLKREDKRYVSVDVAYGIRARVYQVMQKWPEALSDAEKAISLSTCRPYSMNQVSVPAFIDIEDNSWMWGVLVTDKDRVSTTGICNYPSHMGSLNYGYASAGAWRRINKKLFASIPDTDVRKGWFLDKSGFSANLTEEALAYLAGSKAPAYTQVKFAPKNNVIGISENDNDVPLMRIEEMYLLKAEAQAMGGDVSGAVATLNSFVTAYRNPAFSCAAATAEAVQEVIWQQRRIEFWGEGISWFDIMRLSKGVNRLGCGYGPTAVFNIQPGDGVMLYSIPHAEEQYNPLLVNNPKVAIPQPIPDEE